MIDKMRTSLTGWNAWIRWQHFYKRFRAFLGKGWVIERTPIKISFEQDQVPAPPIFVIGTNRSGTSLVRRILDSHSAIACPPETFFLAHYANLAQDPNAKVGMESMGISDADAISAIKQHASFFHNSYRIAKNKRRWADKTPQYVYCLDGIDRIFGRTALYVWVTRNPLDVAYSIWSRGWNLKNFGGDRLSDVCLFVKESWQKQRAFFESLDRDRYMVLRYEQLATSPEPVVRSLMEFLGEHFEDQILRFWEMPHDFGTEDPVVRGTKRFQISAGTWKGWDDASQARAINLLQDVLDDSGYIADADLVNDTR